MPSSEILISYAVLAAMLSLSHLVQGVTGFGSIVLALPVLSFFFPLKTLIPVLIFLAFFQDSYIALRERRCIVKREALLITGLAVLGLPLGYLIFDLVPVKALKTGLGLFVTAVAIGKLSGLRRERPLPRPVYLFLNFAGGMVQGMMASAGPLLVIYASRALPDKSAFRATLSVTWTTLNTLLLITYTLDRAWSWEMLPLIAVAAPCVVIGTVLGFLLHDRIPQRPFSRLVYVLLLFTGLALLRPLLPF